MKKYVVIAGNGPSLANINYCRLPQDYDVFRVNNFFFEDRYFLGKRVTQYITSLELLNYQYYNIYKLNEQEDYNIENITAFHFEDIFGKIPQNMIDIFPHVSWILSRYTSIKKINDLLAFENFYHNKYPSTGTIALLHAIEQGYTDIYIVGIDFHQTDIPYTFQTKKPNYYLAYERKVPKEELDKGLGIQNHSRELDINIIKLCTQIPNIRLYSICDKAKINEIVKLAPIQTKKDFVVEDKTENHITDWFISPYVKTELEYELQEQSKTEPKDMNDVREQLRTNIFFRFIKDFRQLIHILWKQISKKSQSHN